MSEHRSMESLLGGNVVPIRPESPLDRPLKATMWANFAATEKHPVEKSLRQWRNAIKRTSARRKALLPWLKFATFGDTVNPEKPEAGCLRHDGNVLSFDGIEGDYDGKVMPMDVAADKAEAAGISCLFHESPSSTPQKPRWRVLAAMSREYAPEERARILARLNGVLGGVLNGESFALSQSYYFGRDESHSADPPRVILVDGDYLDRRTDLDSGAIGKSAAGSVKVKTDGEVNRDVHLSGIAASCRKRGLTEADFRREVKANPIAWDHVQRDKKGRARTPATQERTLKRAWDWAVENLEPYFDDMAGVTPGAGDVENGIAFAARYKGQFLHVAGAWLRWDGARWAPCAEGEHVQAAKALAGELMKAAAADHAKQGSDATKARLKRAAATYEDRGKLAGMWEMAKTEPGIVATPDKFDRDPWVLGVRNGLLDLKTGELIPPQPDQYVRLRAGAEFDPEAECPRWREFLERILPDREIRRFVQTAVGYTLIGVVDEECFFFMKGEGANGKSVFANVLTALLGDYAATIGAELLLKTKHESDYNRALARLSTGPRLALINEVARGDVWDDAKIKTVVSREKIATRLLYGESFDFTPTHTVWIRGNHAPGSHDAGHAFWRRLVPIAFDVRIPKRQQEPDLDRRIVANEIPGVLAWALEGARRWQRDGLLLPEPIEVAKEGYRAATDIVGQWLAERTTKDPEARTPVGLAFESFRAFCTERGTSAGYINQFSDSMRERGYRHRGDTSKALNFGGLALNSAAAERFK